MWKRGSKTSERYGGMFGIHRTAYHIRSNLTTTILSGGLKGPGPCRRVFGRKSTVYHIKVKYRNQTSIRDTYSHPFMKISQRTASRSYLWLYHQSTNDHSKDYVHYGSFTTFFRILALVQVGSRRLP